MNSQLLQKVISSVMSVEIHSDQKARFIESLKQTRPSECSNDQLSTAVEILTDVISCLTLSEAEKGYLSCEADNQAVNHIDAGFENIHQLLDGMDKPPTMGEALLIANFATMRQREIHHRQIIGICNLAAERLSDMSEALDFIAATRPDQEG